MSRIPVRACLVLMCCGALVSARADDAPGRAAPFGDPMAPVNLSGQVSLANCVTQALSRNFNVRIQQYGVVQAAESVAIQEAAFEPILGFAANKSVLKEASSQLQFTIPYTATETADFTLNDTLVTGGTLSANYGLVRTDNNPAFGPVNPSYTDSASISVTQPLLHGAGTDYNRAAIENARLNVRISNLNFKSAVLTMVYGVETTYFNLLYQREVYKVQQDTLKQTQQLLDENTFKRQTGVLTDLDVMNAKAGVARAQNQLILDQQAVHSSEDALLQLVGDREFKSAVGSVDFPFAGEPSVSFDESYRLARENGPDLETAQAMIDQYKLTALTAKRDLLPTLDVNGGYGKNSYASTAYQSATGVWNGYSWNAGVSLSVPWGLKAGRARYRQALSGVRSEELAYDQADQNLIVHVRAAIRGVDTSIASVRSSADNTQYAAKAYELTKAQFDAGLATSYLVLQSENTLETARVSELQAKVNLLSAIANLRFLEGSSLQLYRINLPE